MQVGLAHVDQYRGTRRIPVHRKFGEFFRIRLDPRPAVQPRGFIHAGHEENQPDIGIRDHVG